MQTVQLNIHKNNTLFVSGLVGLRIERLDLN